MRMTRDILCIDLIDTSLRPSSILYINKESKINMHDDQQWLQRKTL